MTSVLSKRKSTKKKNQNQLEIGLAQPIEANSSLNPVDFESIAAEAPRGKEPKGLRVERQLLRRTEMLREQTNLNFSEYVEQALLYFNACLDEHLSNQAKQTNDRA